MALTYRNTIRGHTVTVPEPADILATAEAEAERLARLGTKRARLEAELVADKAQSQAIHQRQTLVKMDESRKWERCVPSAEPAPPPAVVEQALPEPVEVKPKAPVKRTSVAEPDADKPSI